MGLFKQKLTGLSPLIVLIVIVIFSLTIVPSISPVPKNLPIAIVNEDSGVVLPNGTNLNVGDIAVENILQASAESAEDSAVKWIKAADLKEVNKGMGKKEYYAALVIPENFSQKQATLQTGAPESATVDILINQGMNTPAANLASQILNSIVDNLNMKVRQDTFNGLEQAKASLTPKQAEVLASPIIKKITNVNEIGDHSANGNVPVSLFQPIWMASLIGAILLFVSNKNMTFHSRKDKFSSKIAQLCAGIILSLTAGFGLTLFADGALGLEVPKIIDTSLFVAVSYLAFFLMISAVLAWVGLAGVPIFALILFFGAPLLAMAPELMPTFYQDWIYPWLPMRFMTDGLRELFFFEKGFSWSHSVSTLVWIGACSLLIMFLSIFKPERNTAVQQNIRS
ncbi:YhgE/Pip domain-containing protein [Cytobacillus purgationiresistens]|uniref:YhgE/Pip-like protein n=1 Tax=Cytobacillus purgationiresistens TaxID=863449 RepID=A0ABU0ATS8_9BACI|nr:ABC transporter permease [Cytobacillus purgationiresistens]MDQ0273828.1 YhgE/Pip-like protein [Cytobacillus purgationiresistens]